MLQCHGVIDAQKKFAGRKSADKQHVIVCDGDGVVEIELSSICPAGLTPDQARWIAQLLCEAADRVDANTLAVIAEIEAEEAKTTSNQLTE